ncbi:MAG: hypothetical protein WBW92_13095 [Rhodanobacteraceae bacterium]
MSRHHSSRRIRAQAAFGATLGLVLSMAGSAQDKQDASTAELLSQVKALTQEVEQLKASHPPPELGQQMLELQIRHDRLWWAGQSGDWTLAYFMVGELSEAFGGIERTNGDAPGLQPHKLSELMPAMMDPAIKGLQEALAKQDKRAFAEAYDNLSTSCTGCHKIAGAPFLTIQRPKTPMLDNLREKPAE